MLLANTAVVGSINGAGVTLLFTEAECETALYILPLNTVCNTYCIVCINYTLYMLRIKLKHFTTLTGLSVEIGVDHHNFALTCDLLDLSSDLEQGLGLLDCHHSILRLV